MGSGCRSVALLECRGSVYTHGQPAICLTLLENSGVVVSWHVPGNEVKVLERSAEVWMEMDGVPLAALLIVDMFAPCRSLGTRLARSETELRIRHKVLHIKCPSAKPFQAQTQKNTYRPLMNLLQRPKSTRKHQPTHRVPIPIRTVWVKFTAFITFRDVELRQIACSRYLNKVGCLDEVSAFDGAVGD